MDMGIWGASLTCDYNDCMSVTAAFRASQTGPPNVAIQHAGQLKGGHCERFAMKPWP